MRGWRMKFMKTSGVDAVLSALTGDSASVNGGKGPVGDSAAFNAAFDAAARNAGENDHLKSDSSRSSLQPSSSVHDDQQGGNALPNNGKELPNTEEANTAEVVSGEALAVTSTPVNALAPSSFMKAALDSAAAVVKPEASAGTPSQLSTPVKAQQTLTPGTHTVVSPGPDSLTGQSAWSAPVPTSVNTPGDAQVRPVLPATPTVAVGSPIATVSAGSATTEAPRAPSDALPVTDASPRSFGQELVAATNKAAPSSSDIAASHNSPALPRTGPLTSGSGGRQGTLGASSDSASAGNAAVSTALNATEFSTTSGAGSAKALQSDAFDVALESSQARTNGSREGIPVNAEVAPRVAEAPANSVAGLNPTTRTSELTPANVATQVTDFKATPNAADFPQEVVARVRMIQGQGGTEARLNLHPAELGRLQIAITSEGDATRVAFVVDNAQAKEALEQAMPRLREFLQQAGLQLAEGSVSQQGQQDSAEFAQNEARSGDTPGGDSEGPDNDGVFTDTPSQPSDPNRIFDAYA